VRGKLFARGRGYGPVRDMQQHSELPDSRHTNSR
jgi:hypothetical protein